VTGEPARYWREVIRRDYPRFEGDELAFQRHIRELHRAEPAGVGKFVLSVALLTYGDLSALDDILDNLPAVAGHPARILARAVDALLPPAAGDTLADPDAVRAWVHHRRDRLVWSEERGGFELRPPP
jgi:hypothetical protein